MPTDNSSYVRHLVDISDVGNAALKWWRSPSLTEAVSVHELPQDRQFHHFGQVNVTVPLICSVHEDGGFHILLNISLMAVRSSLVE